MRRALRRLASRSGTALKLVANAAAGRLVAALLVVIRRFDRVWTSNLFAAFTRTVGPWLREHRIGRANLRAAFPDKSEAEIERILIGVWDNLGRVAAEFAHLDRICAGDPMRRDLIDYDAATIERFARLRDDGRPALVFAAHLANWELPAIVAHSDGLPTTVLYRRPNLRAVADAVLAIRSGHMGEMEPTGLQAPVKLGRALQDGRHVAMLVDQHYVKGVEVTFFGRTCLANPLLAMLARQVDAPIHGTRVIRLPGHRFRAEISEEIAPVRDADGGVDIKGTMQAITTVIEGWIREHPEQWLWLHRRWR
jgi:Kdo2-lipid IVA lauroyltransferase/acyltransferase